LATVYIQIVKKNGLNLANMFS